jgi:hypothetical protein
MLIIISLCTAQMLHAQNIDRSLAFHFSNPLGIASKFRIKAEYRLDVQNAFLVSYTKYWGNFPGYGAGAEYRSYWQTLTDHENYVYVKGGLGNVRYRPFSVIKDESFYYPPGNYFYGGAGIGRHWNFNHFFIDCNLGAKFTGVTASEGNYNEVLFYLTGPGSVLDLNFHLGYQL